jgi:reverse gyrase
MIALVGCTSEQEHDDKHDHSVEIEGKDMKLLSVQEVADLWEIDSQVLLQDINQEFELKSNYTTNSILEEIREEYKFSPAQIKDMAEEIKQQGAINE